MVETIKVPIQNTNVVLREESDEWAMLFDPDSGETYGLDPISIFIWKQLDGTNSIENIVNKLKEVCIDKVPENALQDISSFVDDLAAKKLVCFN